jgi:hypothetical protein
VTTRLDAAKGVASHILDATTRNTIDATLEAMRSLAKAIEASHVEIIQALDKRK